MDDINQPASITSRRLSLDFLTALELSPSQMVDQAVANGCNTISLLVHDVPSLPFFPPSQIGSDTPARRDLRSKCADLGVAVDMTELFIMSPEVNVGSFEQAFESSAFLGATSVNAVAYDRDRPRLENNYGRFCELASSYGLGVITEIHRKLTHNSLKAAVDFFGPLGVDVKVELDVLHFYRYGGKTDEISNYRHWIARAQMCDGPQQASDAEYEMQALFHRQMPGYGALPLVEFFAALPVDIVIGVEVPNSSYRTNERIQLAFAESRRILQQADALRPQAGAADFRYE